MSKLTRLLVLIGLVIGYFLISYIIVPSPLIADTNDRLLERMARAEEDQAKYLQEIARELAEIKRKL